MLVIVEKENAERKGKRNVIYEEKIALLVSSTSDIDKFVNEFLLAE